MKLLPALETYRKKKAIVFAVPRGGVPLGFTIARHFNFPLEVLLTKKIGHPFNKEYAIGAVTMEDYELRDDVTIPQSYIAEEVRRISATLNERYHRFMGADHRPPDLAGKTVIIVDDGAATGSTILSAIKIMRKKNPAKIVAVLPVASPSAASKIAELANDLVCLYIPNDFQGVGQFYDDFTQVSDEEVIQLLKQANSFGSAA